MASNVFNVGDLPRLEAQFKNIDGEQQDPTTVTFKIQIPDEEGTVVTYVYGVDSELVKDPVEVGRYHVDYTITVKGMHKWWTIGTGLVQAVEGTTFRALSGAP